MRLNKRRPGLAFGSPASKRRPGLAFGSPASRRCAAGRFQVQVSDSDLSLFWISTFESTVLSYYFFIYLNRRSITRYRYTLIQFRWSYFNRNCSFVQTGHKQKHRNHILGKIISFQDILLSSTAVFYQS